LVLPMNQVTQQGSI